MDDHTVRELISGCPLMEEIILLHCPGFKNLHVFGLHKLKELILEVSRDDHLERVHTETPSLQTLFIVSTLWGYTQPCTINMDACHDLKRLTLHLVLTQDFHSTNLTLNIAFFLWINRELISSCPLMEEIIPIRCAGFKNLHIFGLDKLKQVVLLLPPAAQLERIHINEAPSLQSLSIDSASRSMNLCTIDVEECAIILKHFPLKLSSSHELHIACKWIGRLTISSHNLRRLKLHKCNKLVEVQIDTPNLLSLEYDGKVFPSTLIKINAPCPWHLKFQLFLDTCFGSLWSIKLKELLKKSSGAVYLNIRFELDMTKILPQSPVASSQSGKDFSKSRTMSSVLVGVERLIVEVRSCYSIHMFLVEGLLWSCRPRNLSVMSNDNEHKKLAEKGDVELEPLLIHT
ncbi:unnamed protein product [Prunus armeniaca]|uniref:Uncharacterized protein n=1 Tax=Prunus armeniaca TaxID=36596 RepID=A0A6J5UAR6_PRUAR|nr:unnamed protein product [Prunus armeniaca]